MDDGRASVKAVPADRAGFTTTPLTAGPRDAKRTRL